MRSTPGRLMFLCGLLWFVASTTAYLVGQEATFTNPASRRAPPAVWDEAVAQAIQQQMVSDRIPGLSCAIGKGGAVVWQRGFGLADVENDVPATAATVYRLASVSKPITAIAAMQLWEAGKLDLDRDVHELVPAWPAKQWPVTTRHLLAHLGGVRHYRPGEAESTFHYGNQTEALPRFAADPLLHEPGTKYHYSTYGYNLVAAAIEQVTGEPFAKVVQERIAVPSGAATLQADDVRRLIRGRAQGYVFVGDELRNSELMDASYKLGGGGLCCAAPDLVRVVQALTAGKLVQPDSLATMWTPVPARGAASAVAASAVAASAVAASDYGLGFRIAGVAGRRVVSHGGAQARVSTMLYVLPDQGLVIVLLCNLEKVRLQPLAQQIAALVEPSTSKGAAK